VASALARARRRAGGASLWEPSGAGGRAQPCCRNRDSGLHRGAGRTLPVLLLCEAVYGQASLHNAACASRTSVEPRTNVTFGGW